MNLTNRIKRQIDSFAAASSSIKFPILFAILGIGVELNLKLRSPNFGFDVPRCCQIFSNQSKTRSGKKNAGNASRIIPEPLNFFHFCLLLVIVIVTVVHVDVIYLY